MTTVADNAQEFIGQLSTHDDWQVRRRAALALGRHPEEGVLEALETALTDRDPDVRHAAVLSLGALGDERAIELLCLPRVLEDSVPEIRWAAVTALGELGSLKIANALSRSLEDREWVVRNQALLVISEFIRRIPEAIDGEQIGSLIRLLPIPDEEVRGLVVGALARRSTRGLDEMVEALKSASRVVRAGVAEALGLSHDPRAVCPLIEATQDPIAAVRREAARGLGLLEDERAVEPLIQLLGDSDRQVTVTGVEALIAIGERAVVSLCSALDHVATKVHRRYIIRALGGIRHSASVLPLLNNLSSSYHVVRRETIRAVSGFGDEVVDDLLTFLQVNDVPLDALLREAREQPNKRLRLRAVRSLGELKHPGAIKPLKKLMDDPDRDIVYAVQEAMSKIALAAWARNGAVIALGNIGNHKAVPALITTLADRSENVRGESARALGKLGDMAAVSWLIGLLENDENQAVRREGAAALHSIGVQSPEVAAAFRKALGDPFWEVRVEAARGLGRSDDPESVGALMCALEDESYTVIRSAEHALGNLGAPALPRLFAAAAGSDSRCRVAALRALQSMVAKELRPEVEALAAAPEEERAERVAALREKMASRD